MTAVRVRGALPAEAAILAEMANDLNDHVGIHGRPFTPERVLADGFGPAAAFTPLVAELDGAVVGYAFFSAGYNTDVAARSIVLHDLFVTAAARGARRGLRPHGRGRGGDGASRRVAGVGRAHGQRGRARVLPPAGRGRRGGAHHERQRRAPPRPGRRRIHPTTLTSPWTADTMCAMASYETKTRRFSRAEYERLIDLGVFQPGEPIELIGGELMVAEPQGVAHYTAIVKTARALEAAFGPGWHARTQGPIGLDDDSEPEPDIAVVPGSPEDYSRAHPSRPVLTVEVAESSLAIDRQRKGSLSARAGLAD